jgi:hypothetical protein
MTAFSGLTSQCEERGLAPRSTFASKTRRLAVDQRETRP